MLYHYRYIDLKGKKKTGLIDAEGITEAKEKLRLQKMRVLSVQEKPTSFTKRRLNQAQGKAASKQHLITFTTQLSQLLIAGMPLYESLLCLEEQYRHEFLHPVILRLSEQIKKGASLSEALALFPFLFNRLYCAMIAAGESVGALSSSLDKLALLLVKQSRLKKQLTTSLLYPIILFAFSTLVCLLLVVFVIPSLEVLFEGRDVNRFTGFVIGVSHFFTQRWAIYLPLLGCVSGGGIYLYSSAWGKRALHRLSLFLPLSKTLVIHSAIARFARTMGSLLQGGVPILQALQIARKVLQNPFLEEVIEEAEARITEGSLLSQELKKSSLIPKLVPRLLAIGEEAGNAAGMLHKIADFYEDEVDKTLLRITTLAQPVVLVIMGGIVGLIMLAILLPLTDINAFL